MATLAEPPTVMSSSTSPMPTVYEQDIDSFINLDQLTYTSAEQARPKAILASQPSLPSSDFTAGDVRSATFAANGHSPMTFQGPSHQYEEHKQQTGLPPGALAQAMNFNQMAGVTFGNASPAYQMNGDMFASSHMKREDTSFDFNNMSSRNPSEMDLESDGMGAIPYYLSPNVSKNQFIDPNALGGHEVVSAGPSTQVGRMYPGMHQQQAAMAKAAQQQQKQHEMLRQQQFQQQQQQSQPPRAANPAVEERITRLLQQLRQSAMGAIEDTPSPSASLPQMAKMKKDEQDMDEDERLLASEEGKKLSSKERRQLRNKVSARAFRSRRKEYIGQLESEVAARTNEAHELRLQNRVLYEENARLTDLARMLLSSPHFSQFLDEMSVNGVPTPNLPQSQSQVPQSQPQQQQQQQPPQQQQQQQQQNKPQSQPQPMGQPPMQASIVRDPTPNHSIPVPQNPQVGMVMVPNQPMDVSAMGLNNSAWNTGIDMSYGNTPVFAVLEVPEGPALDTEMLSGKSSTLFRTCLPEVSSAKDEIPMIERPPNTKEETNDSPVGVENPDIQFDESDPAFALFADSPAKASSSDSPVEFPCTIRSEKSSPAFELVVENESKATADRFIVLCNTFRLVPSPAGSSCFSRAASYLKSRHRVYEGTSGPPKLSVSRPFKALRTRDYRRDINPEAYLLRAPKLVFRRGKTYVIYNPASHQDSGFDSTPTSPVGNKPMKFYYQVLTTPTADTPGTTVVLHFPEKRYFFGQISEGTQRACTERGVKLSYLTDIFLTGRTEWANNGGLIGVILTLADGLASAANALELTAREKEAKGRGGQPVKQQAQQQDAQADRGTLTIHGGRNLTHTLATARRFVFRKGMPVFTREYDSESLSKSGSQARTADPFEQPTWSDRNIKVWAMPIRPSPSQRSGRASPQVGPQSPRKRSLDEFQERHADKPALSQRTRDQIMRQSVISDMFNSSWRMDALVETPLAEVKMPAVMFVRDPETKDLKPYHGPAPGSDKPLPDIKVLVRQPWPGAGVEKLPPTTRCDEAVSYIVRNHDLRGKFDPQKAKELNVRAGPNFARLTKGENVLSEDGKTVTPDMVLGPPRLGKGLAIIDLPTSDYVDDLVDRPEWNSASVTRGLEAFLWILGPGVGDHPRLREFVARMSHCKHTVSSTDYCPNYLALSSVAGSSIRLARLRGENYPVPVHDNKTLPQPGTPTSESETTKEMIRNSPFEPVKPGLVIDMEPKFELNRSEVVPLFNPAETVQRIPRSIEQRVTAIRRRVMNPQFQEKLAEFRKDLPGANVEIVTLGTGSSSPSKYRNVSSTLVNVPGVGSYLLDCGENTIGQLKRMYEPKKLQEVLQNLRLIWISHLHADHHLGTASVIKEWFRANYPNGVPGAGDVETDMRKILKEKRLFVVSEEMMIGWLEEYAGVEDYGFGKLVPLAAHPSYINPDSKNTTKFTYRHCRDDGSYPGWEADGSRPQTSTLDFNDDSSPLAPLLRQATGLADILTTRVSHCRGAMAVSLVFPDGFKLSFSGDCRPSTNFATIGRDSTVLIHEATFQDDMAVSAIAKKHSTTSEALEVGRMMQARTVVLTHFSQRYQKVAHVDHGAGAGTAKPEPEPKPAPMTRVDLDVPDDEPEPAPEPVPSTLTVTPAENENKPPLQAPVTAAFDYMRIRVGDIPIAQAFAPAIEKLFDILERASAVEANKQKKIREAADALAKEKKQKQKKKGAAGAEPLSSATPAAATGEAMDIDQGRSVWSASESENGWGSNDDEWMDRFWRGKHSRSRSHSRSKSASGRRSSPSIRTKSGDAV
ncbi:hypothetical protein KXW61_008891 [Aspergillus fumigatus]|nr:hypothetical protein KXW61_008891 [Aspergillus fumigatus]